MSLGLIKGCLETFCYRLEVWPLSLWP